MWRVGPPECVDIEHLNVDAALVQFPNPVGTQRASTLRVALQRRPFDDVPDLRDAGMRVHIDHFDALAAYADIAMHDGGVGGARLTLPAALSTALRGCITHEGAVCSPQSRRRTCHALNEISAIRHTLLLHRSNLFKRRRMWRWPSEKFPLWSTFRLSGYHG